MKITYLEKPSALADLIAEHRRKPSLFETWRLHFHGVDGFDVYNVSQEFDWNGKRLIAGRVEARDSEVSSVYFFEKIDFGVYRVIPGAVIPLFQDPCIAVIDDQVIVGGTKIETDVNGRIFSWHTAFYAGNALSNLKLVAEAPAKMKDVRLVQTDRIHVFTRPQGGHAGAGMIGYYSCYDLAGVNPLAIAMAPLLTTQFPEGCWGGVNQILPLKNGLLGIVGHIATMSAGDIRHYYGMAFAFDPKTRQRTKVKILCERNDFALGMAKRSDLADVVFLGGLQRMPNCIATIYTGLSDAEAHAAVIDDPFCEYEDERE